VRRPGAGGRWRDIAEPGSVVGPPTGGMTGIQRRLGLLGANDSNPLRLLAVRERFVSVVDLVHYASSRSDTACFGADEPCPRPWTTDL